jgi:hypothetical protein
MDSLPLRPFYRAAALGLRALDGRGVRRRFGEDADARWRQFRGELRDADRFDLLLRDAATVAPLAFAPREVFGFAGLSAEDPFGPAWEGPPQGLAGELLRADERVPEDVVEALDAAVARWEARVATVPEGAVPRVSPGSRVVCGGVGAIRALAAVFAAQRERLDLAEQVVLVADRPVERQLFGLAGVFLGATGALRSVTPGASEERVRALLPRVDAVLVSDDASEAVRGLVARITPR